MASILVLTPDPAEAAGMQQAFTMRGVNHEPVRIGVFDCASVPALDMLVAVGGNGKAQYGIQAQYLIDRCPGTEALICVGAAGALSENVDIGDIVLGTMTVEHDYKERFHPRPLPRWDGSARLLGEFSSAASAAFPFRVHCGAIASGDEDVVDRGRAAQLRESTGALCVAWEGSGGARAARLNGLEFLEFRGITDAADGDAARMFSLNIGDLMRNTVDLMVAWAAGRAPIAPPRPRG